VSSDKVDIKGYAFTAGTTAVKAGTTVTWTNDDAFPHSVVDDNGGFSGPPIDPRTTFTHTFDKPGTFAYHCGIHNYMTGKVTVTT
jgi:plastocyanin